MSRTAGIVLLSILIVLSAAMVLVNLLLPPAVVTDASPARVSFNSVVTSIVGKVEIRKKGSKKWTRVKLAEKLYQGDKIRTGLFSEATLQLRGSSSVTVAPNSSFVVGEEKKQNSSFELGEGSILAAIPHQNKREFKFHSKGSDAVASSKEGEFSMTSDGKGTVVVDSYKGMVKIKSKGKTVKIKKGKRSLVLPAHPPTKALAIPSSIALQVKWPPLKTSKTKVKLTGKTSLAATVMVNGILIRPDSSGQFSFDVPLQEGKNRLVVTSTDASGKTTTKKSPEITVDTSRPDLKVDAEDLWK